MYTHLCVYIYIFIYTYLTHTYDMCEFSHLDKFYMNYPENMRLLKPLVQLREWDELMNCSLCQSEFGLNKIYIIYIHTYVHRCIYIYIYIYLVVYQFEISRQIISITGKTNNSRMCLKREKSSHWDLTKRTNQIHGGTKALW